ncbi:MAG: hypothetical protein PHF74_07485 [Dehalococcoidales bacterium]|nr:hypothetical protein [Dehalococcoidales bacterium]
MLKELIKIKEGIIDILWPKMCLGCGKEGRYICKDCEIFLSEAEISERPVMSVWQYEGLMAKLISKIKGDGCYDIINELIDKAFEKIELTLPADTYITYVPMCRKKEKRQGFNSAELIAKKVGEMTNRPVVSLLEKIKDNRPQAGLNPPERLENVKNVFRSKEDARFNNVLVVDDFRISGSTMEECFKVLKFNGIKNIRGFTLAGII